MLSGGRHESSKEVPGRTLVRKLSKLHGGKKLSPEKRTVEREALVSEGGTRPAETQVASERRGAVQEKEKRRGARGGIGGEGPSGPGLN